MLPDPKRRVSVIRKVSSIRRRSLSATRKPLRHEDSEDSDAGFDQPPEVRLDRPSTPTVEEEHIAVFGESWHNDDGGKYEVGAQKRDS
ncbi:unnamed protein product [Nippostrongylus brasiliensis]|uniref:Uncharacterized protein n=1 Tax=Nippostrongylus brasiliensis TaxID=27835 RepID=A0A0N4YKH8_NIPBR|nr:unnamed protein product [Nippostrongylus brasiliensis]